MERNGAVEGERDSAGVRKKNVCQEKAECGLDTCRNFVTAAVLAQRRRSKIRLKGTVCDLSECFHLHQMCLSPKIIPLDKS